MGGGGETRTTTQIIQPTPPPQPSTAEAIQEYVKSLPQIFQAQLEFAPKEAQQQLDIAQQFALPFAQIAKDAQSTLFPETTAIQEQLAQEARRTIEEGAPESFRNRFRDEFKANLGTNVGSPIGAEATARAVADLDEQFRANARNTALSLAGRQPLAQPQTPGFTNQLQQISPVDVLNFRSQNFNTFAQASRPLIGQNSVGRTSARYIPDFNFGANFQTS